MAPDVGIELQVVSLMPTAGHPYERELQAAGAPVRSLDLPTRWDPRALPKGLPLVRDLAPHVVHTHLKHADLVGAFAARRLGLPMVSTLHLIEEAPGGLGRAKRRLAAQARLATARRTITVSESQRRWYLATFSADPARVVTVRNGVPAPAPLAAEDRARLRSALGVGAEDVMATMVGIMRPGKGHDQLLAAAALVPESLRVTFVLAGDGPLRARLEAEDAARGGNGARVVFAGFREDVADLLAASDLVVHPSLAEALPTALIHALASGRPTVASAVGGVPEVVTPDTGVLVPPGDVASLVGAVAALAGDPERRRALGAAARRRFEAEFDVVLWARRLRAVYEEVLEGCG